MGKEIDLVRYRNDGDEFHVLWTARRALRLLDPRSGLVALAVEGISEREAASVAPSDAGLLVVDTTEYFGSEDLTQATQVVYYQLKYSTTHPATPWTVAGLSDTLAGFAERFAANQAQIGRESVVSKIRYRFVSNRPISVSIQKAMAAVAAGTPVSQLDARVKATRKSLLKATSLKVPEFNIFAGLVDLWGNQDSLDAQARAVEGSSQRYAVSLDSGATKRMKDLVREKALSKSRDNNTINLDLLLQQFGLGSEGELLPAEPKFETLNAPIPRTQEEDIARQILAEDWPVILQAAGGIGKSVLCQQLPTHLPPGSESVIFDGFAGGDYRNPRRHRHKHSRGLVQITNELARRGLCDVLIPQPGASPQDYLEAFYHRLEQATAVVRSRSRDAALLIVIDAADNLGMAADDYQDRSFAPDLLMEAPPTGCHIVATARYHRVDKYLKPIGKVARINIEPFDLIESSRHLRQKFPNTSDEQAENFHRYTDRNPRVQANALAVAGDLSSLLQALGPAITTFDKLIDAQLDAALDKVIHEQASSRSEIAPICTALAALSPPIPIRVLAKATTLSDAAVRSFISDFGGGRFIVLTDDTVQFHDEPVETWFHEKFLATPAQSGQIADILGPLATTDAYVAAVLPVLLYRAERYDELMRLALQGAEPDTSDPVERREIVLRRVQYALKVALLQRRQGDAAKLLLRAGEEAAANRRQSGFLMAQADLVSSLAGPDVVSDFIFRQHAWEESQAGYAYCAAMLATDSHNAVEAERFMSLAKLWLEDWFDQQRKAPNDEPDAERGKIEIEDIATYADAVRLLRGAKATVSFMKNWRDWAVFKATGIVAARVLDRGSLKAADELLAAAGNRLAMRLAIIQEMCEACVAPSAKQIKLTIELLTADQTALDLKDYPEDTTVLLGVVATAEAAARCGIAKTKIRAALARYPCPHSRVLNFYDRGSRRETILRAAALMAALTNRQLTLDDVKPASLMNTPDKPDSGHERESREFKEIYGALVPWYRLRALAIARRADKWSDLVAIAQQDCRTERWGWGGNPELGMAINELGRAWFEALIWSDRNDWVLASEIEQWLIGQRVTIGIATWTSLARRASIHHASYGDNALAFAQRARELLEGDHADATQTADSFASLARATLPLGQEEASGYFNKALEHLSRLGDELYERMFAILALAKASAIRGCPDPHEAYRVARMGELFHAYNDHKFPWSDVVEAVTHLCPSSGFAIVSRWNDRAKTSLARTLPEVVLSAIEIGAVRPAVAAALHAFGGYWQLKTQAGALLDRETDGMLKQAILDTLALDSEFDRDHEDDAATSLLEAGEAHGLRCQRLRDLAAFRRQSSDGDHDHVEAWTNPDRDRTPPPKPDWSAILSGLNLRTTDGVDEAIQRWRPTQSTYAWEDLFEHLRQATPVPQRRDHVLAIAHSEELSIDLILNAIDGCSRTWSASIAVQGAVAGAINIILRERSAEIIDRGWALNETVQLSTRLSNLPKEEVLQQLMQGFSDDVEHASVRTFFNLAGTLADNSLTSDQAKDALKFSLDRLEPVYKANDGDGSWREGLAPPHDVAHAVAGLVYAMLASPFAEMRWRAAHATRRLCRLGEAHIVSALVDLLSCEELPTFTDAELPFYPMHARLYALIALARAADEAPGLLFPLVDRFVRSALDSGPHVLIREFAARTALDLERQRPGLLVQSDIDRLKAVNASPFPTEPRKRIKGGEWGGPQANASRKFTLDYDFDRYWLEPLARAFNLPQSSVADSVETWIVDRWGNPDMSAWDKDERARRRLFDRESWASHGSYPKVDRYSFYLSYHAMFCTAGEMLAKHPCAFEYDTNQWREWLSGHLLTRSDGRWLADRRDVAPLETRRWQKEKEVWEHRDEWPFRVLAEDFDQALGVGNELTRSLTVWGWWFVTDRQRKETISLHSALVTPATSGALLRALQTAENPHDYRIPDEGDDLEVDQPNFQLCGWIANPRSETGLDQFDAFAGILWPGPIPGRRVRAVLKLSGDAEGRVWRSPTSVAMSLAIWGDKRDDQYRSARDHGQRLTADLNFLLEMLNRANRDMIIEVEIERDGGQEKEKEIDYAYRRYTRLYLLHGDGRLETLHGSRSLRSEVGR